MGKKLNFFQRAARTQKKQNERKKNARLAAERREERKENTRRRNEARFRHSSNRSKRIVKNYDATIYATKAMWDSGFHNYALPYKKEDGFKMMNDYRKIFGNFYSLRYSAILETPPKLLDNFLQHLFGNPHLLLEMRDDPYEPNPDVSISVLQLISPLFFPLDFFFYPGPRLEKNNGEGVIKEIVMDENYTTIHFYHDTNSETILLDIELDFLDPEKMKNGEYFLNEYGARLTSSGNNHTEFRHTAKYQEEVANSSICSMAITYVDQITRFSMKTKIEEYNIRISCDGIDGATGETVKNDLLTLSLTKDEYIDVRKSLKNKKNIDPIKFIKSLNSSWKSISSEKTIKCVFDESKWYDNNLPYIQLGGAGSISNNIINQLELNFDFDKEVHDFYVTAEDDWFFLDGKFLGFLDQKFPELKSDAFDKKLTAEDFSKMMYLDSDYEKEYLVKGAKSFLVYKGDIFVGEWLTQSQCAEDLNLSISDINRCLHNKSKSHKGYTFKYE